MEWLPGWVCFLVCFCIVFFYSCVLSIFSTFHFCLVFVRMLDGASEEDRRSEKWTQGKKNTKFVPFSIFFFFSIHALKIPTVNFSKLAVSFTICQPQLLRLTRPYSLSIHKPIIHSMWINVITIDLVFRWLCLFQCTVRELLI